MFFFFHFVQKLTKHMGNYILFLEFSQKKKFIININIIDISNNNTNSHYYYYSFIFIIIFIVVFFTIKNNNFF